MVEKYIETLPFLLDDHPVVFVIVMVVITFLVFNFLLSLGGVA